jgi:hypothetical protein
MGIATSSNELDLKVPMGCQVGFVVVLQKKNLRLLGYHQHQLFLWSTLYMLELGA